MATIQNNLVCDNSTLANFKSWAQAISTAFSTFGWTQSSDTGQVNWSTVTLPGSGATVYEIWQPNDGVTNNFFVKIQYGNWSGQTNSPFICLSIGTSTNGSGTLTGTTIGPLNCANNNFTAPSSSTTYECDFAGGSSYISVLMWRNGTNSCQQAFAIERSVNSSGTYVGTHVTLIVAGAAQSSSDWPHHQQQTIVFGVGAGNTLSRSNGSSNSLPTLCVRRQCSGNGASTAFNSQIPFDTVAPAVGYFDYPLTCVGIAASQDVTEGIAFSVTLYGATRTYMPTLVSGLNSVFNTAGNTTVAFCLRYD